MPPPSSAAKGPEYLRACITCVSEEDTMRVRRIVARHGVRVARALLCIGDNTLDAARDQGRMERKTYARLRETLDRLEAAT